MTTAREQAEQACLASPYGNHLPGNARELSKVASDVWEPLLREACALLRDYGHGGGGEVADFLLRMGAQLSPTDERKRQI